MAKAKKTKKEVVDAVTAAEPTNEIQLAPIGEVKLLESEKLKNCEWCFQFDEDEPQVFAWTDETDNLDEEPKVIFTITNTENSYITFTHKNGKNFKLFARELTDMGRELRAKQTELTKPNL